MRTSNSLYTLLQVLPTADPAVIEAAYKALMKKHHPDLHAGTDAERRAAEISHAFNVLRDPGRRAAYDAEERSREERYRVELARAFPEHGPAGTVSDPARRHAGPPPSRFEPAPRPGHRVAAFVGAAGVLSLIATIILLARGGNEPPSRAVAAAPATVVAMASEDAASSPAAEPVPFRDEPVSGPQVAKAVAEFGRISGTSGIQGAAAFSERCFETQSRTRSIGEFDFCVAFDHAAGRADVDTTQSVAARRFQPQNQVSRHVRAADPLADTFSSIEIRLYEIRRLADAAVARLETPAPAAAVRAAPASETIAPRRYVAVPAAARRSPRPPVRPRSTKREQDFLEREGGIY